VDQYPGCNVKYIGGHNPDLVLTPSDGQPERIDLTKYTTAEKLHELFSSKGIERKAAPSPAAAATPVFACNLHESTVDHRCGPQFRASCDVGRCCSKAGWCSPCPPATGSPPNGYPEYSNGKDLCAASPPPAADQREEL